METEVIVWTVLASIAKLVLVTAGQKECRSVTSINEYALQGHAYLSITGKELITCVVTCDHDPNCYSLNYRFPTSTCELSGETRASRPEDFRYTADSVYLEHLSRPAGSCSQGWPCQNKATCVNVPKAPGFRCYCRDSYIGKLCETCSSPPLGLQDKRIPDSKIAGSSEGQWITTFFPPRLARLHSGSSWVAEYLDSTPWLQVNLGPKTRLVTHIATQGSPVHSWWMKKYTVHYKQQTSWTVYTESGVKKMSWDSYIDNLIDQSRYSGGTAHIDRACIIGLDGGAPWTTADHPAALKLESYEAIAIAKCFKTQDFSFFMSGNAHFEGTGYQFLRVDDGKVALAKKKDDGGITMQRSKTALVVAHCPEGGSHGKANMAVAVIAEYLESLDL